MPAAPQPAVSAPNLWPQTIKAGLSYVGLVFLLGFILGTLRELIFRPMLGETIAVGLELPIMLAASWFCSLWLIRRLSVAPTLIHRLVMGGLAFAVLMLFEIGVSTTIFQRSLTEHISAYGELPTFLGLIGQIIFGLIPAVQLVNKKPPLPTPER